MFNMLSSIPNLFLLTMLSFLAIFTVRQIFITRSIFIFLYHICFFLILFIASIGGGSLQNDGYERLEEFILLEKNNQLEEAKKNPQNYDSMLQIDLQDFHDANEFRAYLKKYDAQIDRAEAVFIGWLFVLLAEISMGVSRLLRYMLSISKGKKVQLDA